MPTLTPSDDMEPSPRVEILFDEAELDGSIDTLTVHQISAAGDIEVRNAILRSAVGGFFITDYEVPIGIPVTYRAEQFDSNGVTLGFTDSADTQVNIAPGALVIQDPLAPENAVLVTAEQRFAEQLGYTRPVRLYPAGLNTVALMGERGLLEGIPLRVFTESEEDAALLADVLAEGTFLVRSMPPFPIPRILHAVVPSPQWIPLDARFGGTWNEWDLTSSQISRNTIDIIVPVVTYERYNDGYATYADFNAARSTYLGHIADPPPEA